LLKTEKAQVKAMRIAINGTSCLSGMNREVRRRLDGGLCLAAGRRRHVVDNAITSCIL
jgi:hypothetical protein